MKYFLLILPFITLSSCGTLGSFEVIEFPTERQNLINAIDTLYSQNPKYKIPERLKHLDNWKQRGYDFLDSRIFYFESGPEEMYYVTIRNHETTPESNPCYIAVRSVYFDGKSGWQVENEFEENQKERIEERFRNEIISKLEKITGIKSKIE